MSNAWVFTVYGDSECETTPSGSHSSDDNQGCTQLTESRRGFELDDMDYCVLTLYSSEDCDDESLENFYDATNQNQCIPPNYEWHSFDVFGC